MTIYFSLNVPIWVHKPEVTSELREECIHIFADIMTVENANVYVFQCPECRDVSVVWGKSDEGTWISMEDDVEPEDMTSFYIPHRTRQSFICDRCKCFGSEMDFLKEIHRHVKVIVSKCSICEKRETVWMRNDRTIDEIFGEIYDCED